MKNRSIFEEAKIVLKKLAAHGFEAFFVGGCVRDAVLCEDVHDVDIATSATPEEVMRIFPSTIPVGIEHGTVIVREGGVSYEVTTFRTEGEYKDYRRPSSVAFTSSLQHDLARRDFTFNAMAMDIDYKVYDPFEGKKALNDQLIVTVGDPEKRFSEDPLRILRAFRFASKYGFALEKQTEAAAASMSPLLKKISVERKRDEMLKLLSHPYAADVLRNMKNFGVLHHLPGMDHKERNGKEADWTVVQTDAERMALLCLLFGTQDYSNLLKEWKLPGTVTKQAGNILSAMRMCYLPLSWHVYSAGIGLAESALRTACAAAGVKDGTGMEKLYQAYDALPIKTRADLPLTGSQITALTGDKPGPWLGRLLEDLEKAVVTGAVPRSEQDALHFIRRWKDERNPPSHA